MRSLACARARASGSASRTSSAASDGGARACSRVAAAASGSVRCASDMPLAQQQSSDSRAAHRLRHRAQRFARVRRHARAQQQGGLLPRAAALLPRQLPQPPQLPRCAAAACVLACAPRGPRPPRPQLPHSPPARVAENGARVSAARARRATPEPPRNLCRLVHSLLRPQRARYSGQTALVVQRLEGHRTRHTGALQCARGWMERARVEGGAYVPAATCHHVRGAVAHLTPRAPAAGSLPAAAAPRQRQRRWAGGGRAAAAPPRRAAPALPRAARAMADAEVKGTKAHRARVAGPKASARARAQRCAAGVCCCRLRCVRAVLTCRLSRTARGSQKEADRQEEAWHLDGEVEPEGAWARRAGAASPRLLPR
jgi:hypothetical protein